MNYRTDTLLFWIISLIFVAVVLLSSCSSASVPAGVESKTEAPCLYSIGLDGSGSYDYLSKAKEVVKSLIKGMPGGSSISVRWITADSYLPANAILSKTFENIAMEDSSNPFDPLSVANNLEQKKKIEGERAKILSVIDSVKSPKAHYTDIYGFLLKSKEAFEEKEPDAHAYLIMSTDLENNVRKYESFLPDGSFRGVDVIVLVYENNDPKSRKYWQDLFLKHWSASSVKYFEPEEFSDPQSVVKLLCNQ